MPLIRFIPPSSETWSRFSKFVDYLTGKKQGEKFDRMETEKMLGELASTKFWHLVGDERREYYLGFKDKFRGKQDFEFWLTGLDEFTFAGLNKKTDTEAELYFDFTMLALGGIHSLWYLIEIFGGKVIDANYD